MHKSRKAIDFFQLEEYWIEDPDILKKVSCAGIPLQNKYSAIDRQRLECFVYIKRKLIT